MEMVNDTLCKWDQKAIRGHTSDSYNIGTYWDQLNKKGQWHLVNSIHCCYHVKYDRGFEVYASNSREISHTMTLSLVGISVAETL